MYIRTENRYLKENKKFHSVHLQILKTIRKCYQIDFLDFEQNKLWKFQGVHVPKIYIQSVTENVDNFPNSNM